MARITPNIVIVGAGIAGLWLLDTLKRQGYDVLLLDNTAIGGTQTLASQGIIHSGLKYMLGNAPKPASDTMRDMPTLWEATPFIAVTTNSKNQQMLLPSGFIGNIVKGISQRAMQGESEAIATPDTLQEAGFDGSVVNVNEPVLNIPLVVRALAEPYLDCIRKCEGNVFDFLEEHNIKPQKIIFAAASGNAEHAPKLKTQTRPLLMGLLKPAPFPLYAHLIGTSDKPVATITTHILDDGEDGTLCWYIGGQIAERKKDSKPQDVYTAIEKAFAKYLPNVDLSDMEFATLPIDRVEGAHGGLFMPDTPTMQEKDGVLYCWPTKLAFAPMLCGMVLEHLQGIGPTIASSNYSTLEPLDFAIPPWDKVTWQKI